MSDPEDGTRGNGSDTLTSQCGGAVPAALRWGDGVSATIVTPKGRFRGAVKSFRYSLYWGALRRQKGWLGGAFLFLVLGAIVTLRQTQIVTQLIDQALDARTRELGPMVVQLVILAVVAFFTGTIAKLLNERIGYQLEFDLRNLLYLRLQRSRPEELDHFATGQVVTRALTDLTLLEYFIRILSGVVAIVPIFLGFTIFLLVSNPILTLITCSAYVINGFIVNKIRHRLWGLSFVGLDQVAKVTAAIDEPVRGIRVMKAFGREEAERGKVASLAARAYQFTMTRVRLEARYDLILRAAPVLIRGLLVGIGARFVVTGSLSQGEFLIFFTFTQIGVTIATFLDEGVSAWQYVKTGAGRITELLRLGARGERVRREELPEPSSGLEMHRATVAFADTTAVSDVSLTVAPGTLTFLTGPPASGKSTIAGLAASGLAPTSGTVLLDGVSLDRLDPEQIAREVHLVTEEPFLFARTLRENLTIGALAADGDPFAKVDDEQLMAALRAAAATDVADQLAGGLDASLGDRGMTLSGGQRQRLALARALVRPPRVLVLDDALSAVSPALEVDILQRIREHAPDTAILCIGRRPGPRSLADEVVELPGPEPRREVDHAAVADSSGFDLAFVAASAGGSMPYDPRLRDIIEKLRFSSDEPIIPESVAAVDERPTFRSIVRPVKGAAIAAVVLTILLQSIGLIPEYVFGEVNDYIDRGDTAATDRLAMGIAAVAFVTGILTYLFRIIKGKATNSILYVLRRRVFGRLSRLGVDYYDRELPGQVATRVVHDLNQVERLLGKGSAQEGIYEMGGHITKFLLAIGLMVWLSPRVGLLMVGFAIVVIALTVGYMPIANKALTRAREGLGDVIARLQEDFAGRYVIHGFGAQRQARNEFGATARSYRLKQRRAENLGAVYSELLDLTGKLASAVVYWRGGSLVLSGALSLGTLFTLRLFLSEALRPIPQMTRSFYDVIRARVSFRQLGSMWDAPILPVQAPDAVPCAEVEGSITFENVSFGYPGTNRPVLHDVSFDVQPGDRVAIVGYTGAGKSSITKLITRVYDPDAGRILVDGRDVRELELTSYRQRIGVVPQEAFLFTGTIASNIAYGRPGATTEEIESAVRAVGAWDTLMALDDGLDTPVEEEGRNLTAGERQLIAIARAVIATPDILVLDEASASLDAATEETVMDAVLALGITTILVTHRLAVAQRSDFVIMIDGGRVVDLATHEELVTERQSYAELWGHATTGPGDAARRRRRPRASRTAPPAKKAATAAKATAKKGAAKKAAAVVKKATKKTAAKARVPANAAKDPKKNKKATPAKRATVARKTPAGRA